MRTDLRTSTPTVAGGEVDQELYYLDLQPGAFVDGRG